MVLKIPRKLMNYKEEDIIKTLGIDQNKENEAEITKSKSVVDDWVLVDRASGRSADVSSFLKGIHDKENEMKESKAGQQPNKETVGLINKLFKTYKDVKREEEYKIDPSKFYFDMNDYIKVNEELPDYLNMKEEILDAKLDYYIKTECILMADEEITGSLYLKRNKLVFRTKTGLGKGNIHVLKKFDEELFEKEIEKLEKQQEWEGTIDFLDIIEVKMLTIESMNQNDIEEEHTSHKKLLPGFHAKTNKKHTPDNRGVQNQNQAKNHDFHIQFVLKAINGVKYTNASNNKSQADNQPLEPQDLPIDSSDNH